MKEKFLQFFTGKLSKSIYIAVASAVVCGAVVIGSAVAVHNHNQEIQMENTDSESVTETVTESATEGVSVTEGNDTTAPTQAANNEPAGDRALQYLAEYDRITEEYEKKRAELEKETQTVIPKSVQIDNPKPQRIIYSGNSTESAEDIAQKQAALDAEYERQLEEWEKTSQEISQAQYELDKEYENNKAKVDEARKELDSLNAQYEKDIAALKERYGIE